VRKLILLLVFCGLAMPSFAQFPLEGVRRPQYAGSWYEADSQRLTNQIRDYLEQAKNVLDAGKTPEDGSPEDHTAMNAASNKADVLAVIAPHAGFMFSGKTAAYSYESARSKPVKRVFLLGPSHHVSLHGVALPQAVTFETPLGNLQVDKETIAELSSYPMFSVQPEIHRVEHALEMQLPFIRQTFGEVKLVPLIIGTLHDESEVRLIAEVLKGYVSGDDIVVVSSDFTHYGPRYGYSPFKSDMRANIEKLDREAFKHLSEKDLSGFLDFEERTHDTICGFFPCAVLCAMLPPDANASLLKYSTSQDMAEEDKDNSVSYLAINFRGTRWPEQPCKRMTAEESVRLSDSEKRSLLNIARKTLEAWVRDEKTLNVESTGGVNITPAMRQCFGAFVTLYKKSKRGDTVVERTVHPDRELRGCIGNIWPVRPLFQTVADNAVSACSKDYRFSPVKPAELKDIEIEISVLTPPRRVSSYKDIELGKDGIILSKNDHQAVFLPFVPTEFGWDLPETLRQLSLKAGLKDSDWQNANYDLFQSLSIEE
jgi:AmmeMemoRadiSam system protein B/AmmeMemoRadiSam system protein A